MLYNLTLTELQTHIVKRAVEAHIDALHTEMYDYNSRDSLDDIRAQIAESHKLLSDLKVSKSNPIDLDDMCEREQLPSYIGKQGVHCEDEMSDMTEEQITWLKGRVKKKI